MIIAIVPAHNEEKTIRNVVSDVAKYVDKTVVIDDGSTDETFQKAINRKTIVLRHVINLGQGAALQTGFDYAKKIKADIVVTYDADGQFVASDIPAVIKPILTGKTDVVLGSRFLGRAINISWTRRIILKLGVMFTYLFTNIRLTDTHNGFRALNQKALIVLDLEHNRWPHATEIIFQLKLHRLRILEIPVTVRYLKHLGQSAAVELDTANIDAIKIPFDLTTRALLKK